MTLAQAIEKARSQDLRARPDQIAATRRLMADIAAIEERLSFHRAAVDEVFFARHAASRGIESSVAGEASLAAYPIGFCGAIRDQVLARLAADPAFRALTGPDVVLKKIFVLLKGVYFQNALQLGNLYVDVANDTVFTDKPKVEWLPIADVDYENADDWNAVAAVGRHYYGVELYPNLLFPLAFPFVPYFAIRSSGRIDFFQAQDILFLKDLGDGLRRTRGLLDDPAFLARPLPEPYRLLIERACGGNLHAAFPLEYAPTDAAGLRAQVLPEFDTLIRQGDTAALATVDRYMRLVKDATRRLMRMNLRPSPGEIDRLRAEGAIPADEG
ncbi:MAG TPA: hypothetical protein VIO38_15270 [Rariglobus sp.]